MRPTILIRLVLALTVTQTPAQENIVPEQGQLVGTWRLVSTQQRLVDGTLRPNPKYGPNGVGYLMYDATHHMCVFLTDPARGKRPATVPPAVPSRGAGPNQPFTAYCGTWSVDASGRYILHKVEMDMDPAEVGEELKRSFEVQGNRLTLRPQPIPAGLVDYFLMFERVEAVK